MIILCTAVCWFWIRHISPLIVFFYRFIYVNDTEQGLETAPRQSRPFTTCIVHINRLSRSTCAYILWDMSPTHWAGSQRNLPNKSVTWQYQDRNDIAQATTCVQMQNIDPVGCVAQGCLPNILHGHFHACLSDQLDHILVGQRDYLSTSDEHAPICVVRVYHSPGNFESPHDQRC